MNKAIVILSGGIDSVTLAHDLYARGYVLHMVYFYYGQKQADNERYCAELCAETLESELTIIDLVAAGLILEPEIGSTVIPNRNAIMLAIAYSIAIIDETNLVAIGTQGGDYATYPDCRPAFIDAFRLMEKLATGERGMELCAPFLYRSKSEIIRLGLGLGIHYEDTWTCYEGGEKPCRICSACDQRLGAFASIGVKDPLEYIK